GIRDVRLDVRLAAGRLGHAIGGTLPGRAVRLRPPAVHPAARRHAVRDLAEGAHSSGILAVPDIPRPLRGDLVPHADRPGWNAVTDGAMERSAARGRPRQRSTELTERAG